MKEWEEVKELIRKVKPNKEVAKSLLKMAKIRLEEVKQKDIKKFASLATEDYYEIIKECITALMSIDGLKTLRHEALVAYLKKFYPQFSQEKIALIDMLRILRNKIVYYGFFVQPEFVERNKERILKIIQKLIKIIKEKVG